MNTALARCVDCDRLFGAYYESQPPVQDDLECACGGNRFLSVSPEDAAKKGYSNN